MTDAVIASSAARNEETSEPDQTDELISACRETEKLDSENGDGRKTKITDSSIIVNPKKRPLEDGEILDPGTSKREKTESSGSKSANGSSTKSEVAQHYNAVPDRGLKERTKSKIFHMRNFNNWIKSIMIGDVLQTIRNGDRNVPVSVLDLCCGKGGDLLKWKKGGIKHLICTDIADVSLTQCEGRYQEMEERQSKERRPQPLFKAQFIHADSSRENLREKAPEKMREVDLCSCQFSIHYGFETKEQALCILRNACESLKPGGYFIGSLPDASVLVSQLRKSPNLCWETEVSKIFFDDPEMIRSSEKQPPLFGAKFHFHLDEVVNLPEYLVHFPLLVKLLEKFDMELVKKQNFREIYDEKCRDYDARGLLGRMQALETYPPFEPVEKESEYVAAKTSWENLQKDPDFRSDRKMGTLSNSEWQVACLYLGFVFRKKHSEGTKSESSTEKYE